MSAGARPGGRARTGPEGTLSAPLQCELAPSVDMSVDAARTSAYATGRRNGTLCWPPGGEIHRSLRIENQ